MPLSTRVGIASGVVVVGDLIDQTGETFALAELHRLEGAMALTTNNQNDAEISLKAAVAVALKQGS